uniref:Xpo1 domain-containing protein n=1 Tax=Heterorhabditis bacteriophora TaxID=37862 RepID=A0A1I7X0U0_HETBA
MATLAATPMIILEEAKKQFQEDGKLNVQLLDQVDEVKQLREISIPGYTVKALYLNNVLTFSILRLVILLVSNIIFRLICEEVFDFGSQNLTQAKEQHLKQQFCGQFQEVFSLCITILEKCPANAMVEATLRTLHRFLSWIPVGYVFETNITQLLSENFLSLEIYRVVTLQCLTEISMIQIDTEDDGYKAKLRDMFCATIKEIGTLLGSGTDLALAYKKGTDQDQKFISCLAQFLVAFLKDHSALVEVTDNSNATLAEFHNYSVELLLSISQVEDVEIFKVSLFSFLLVDAHYILLEYFFRVKLSGKLFLLFKQLEWFCSNIFRNHLSHLRSIMISRMAKPEEVLVVENDQGEV